MRPPRQDAARIGFDDGVLYCEVARPIPKRALPMRQLLRDEALAAFEEWENKANRMAY